MSQTISQWEQDKAQADNLSGLVIGILQQYVAKLVEVVVADDEADRKRATDFIVRVTGGDIACRVRKAQYWPMPGDVTIRNSRPSGVKTEADKIIEGFARWLFYGWAHWPAGPMAAWVIVDLERVRSCRLIQKARESKQVRENLDGSSSFVYLVLADLRDADAITACSAEVNSRLQTRRLVVFGCEIDIMGGMT